LRSTKTLHTPVNFIVHSLQEVNDGLAQGRYFFMDVARDGIALYEADDKELAQAQAQDAAMQALEMAQEYFEEWLPAARRVSCGGFVTPLMMVILRKPRLICIRLPSASTIALLLVCTFYTPHVHNLAFLRTQAERIDMRLADAWPREAKLDRSRFEKLKEAYVKARYSKHYRITEEELRCGSASPNASKNSGGPCMRFVRSVYPMWASIAPARPLSARICTLGGSPSGHDIRTRHRPL
jgi:hypothetical protein